MFFIKRTNKMVSSLLVLGLLNTFANATPNAPGADIGVTDINDTAVRINFLDNSNDEDGFKIVGDITDSIGANDENIDAYVYKDIANLDCNKTYTIKALAYNSDGNSSFSNERSFNIHTTFNQVCPVVILPTTPDMPGAYIGVTDINKTAVRISFLDNSNNESGFKIRGDINDSIGANDETLHSYVYKDLTGLVCNQTYTIHAVAYNSNGDSLPTTNRSFNIHSTFGKSCSAPITIPNAPGPYIGVTDINKTAVRISFLDNSNNETGFKVIGDINDSLGANDENQHPYVYKDLTGLTCNQDYAIQVVAYNASGDSLPSDKGTFNIHTTFQKSCN